MSDQSISVQLKSLPKNPGVYYMKDRGERIIYVGKAANLKRRVSSYFQKAHDSRIERMVSEIRSIAVRETPSVLEALILEANEIKRLAPKYNVRERDNRSFLYLAFTREPFPRPLFVRGHELEQTGIKKFRSVYGPYLSGTSLRAAAKILRKIFPYSTEGEKQKRPCFYYHLKLCPGVCIGAIDPRRYRKNIRRLEMVFFGKKEALLKALKREMRAASKSERFEEAAKLRNQIFSLEHIRDVALLTREERPLFGPPARREMVIDIFGRIEGYDISNISGAESVGSMVVFEEGEPKKSEYRKFKIKGTVGINDVAMMKEVLRRRFAHLKKLKPWPKPDLILIDGGWGQVNAAREVLGEYQVNIPMVGIAKGFKRKQDRPIYEKDNFELARLVEQYKDLMLQVRDEAHRFAISYHRARMRKRIRL